MLSDPNIQHVEQALRSLDVLVVQDIFMSETAQLAHVVLPTAASLEKDGTFTNTERRVQLIHPVVHAPGEAWTDWQIVCALGKRLEERLTVDDGRQNRGDWTYESTAAIMDEIAQVTPIYGGMRYDRLAGNGLVWPCPTAAHPGTPILHADRFSRGMGKFHAVAMHAAAEQPDAEYPLILTTGRILYQYHTGTMTRRSQGLNWHDPRGYAEINKADADAIGLRDGAIVFLHSRRGKVRVQGRISDRVPPGTVFLSFHWKESPANLLTNDHTLDPIAKIPEFKVCAVRLEVPPKPAKMIR